jgi:UTP--glucose-1-phosphate uridylyltransferase
VLIDSETPAIAQLIESFSTMGQPVIGVQMASGDEIAVDTPHPSVGVENDCVVRFARAGDSPAGNLIAAGRYVLTESIFHYLEQTPPAGAMEVELQDALQLLLAHEPVAACEIHGKRFSCHTKLDLLSATVHYGLKHPELAVPFRELLCRVRAAPAPVGAVSTHA